MFIAEKYVLSLLSLLKKDFGERLLYVGLQGSYLRGEANEDSDIDIMVVIDGLSTQDMLVYRHAIESLEDADKSCGFICGLDEIKNWNTLEICHLLHTTKDYYGCLSELVPAYTDGDVRAFVKMSVGNLYHEICHRFIHAPREKRVFNLRFSYKGVFFILQNLHYLETGEFIGTKQSLLGALNGKDKEVLETALAYGRGENVDFDKAFELLFAWCKDALVRTARE
ncbi:MAG: nucleotidyltransferase domain-containing protein [Clostridiales bacterium]|nr:nucleotidyltransferase domain-containing protein [Clostridiales bacterium]